MKEAEPFDWLTLFDTQGLHAAKLLITHIRDFRKSTQGIELTEKEVQSFSAFLLDAAEECVAAMPNGQIARIMGLLAIEAAGLKNNFDIGAGDD